jgi:uncharacterized protein YegL
LNLHQIAIVPFNYEPGLAVGLTNQRDRLNQFLQRPLVADGGTAIDQALNASRIELTGGNHRLNAARVILLLSDGGSENEELTLAVAALAAEQGVQIAVVGLPGEDFNEPLLRQIAAGPQQFWLAQTPQDLGQIYSRLAQTLNWVVATQVQVEEPLTAPGLVDPGSLTPTGVISTHTIIWSAAWLTQSNNTPDNKEFSFMYQFKPEHFGWQYIVENGGLIRFSDCRGQPSRLITPSGPRLLVLPAWLAWLWPLPLLALLLFGVLGWFKKPNPPIDLEEATPPTTLMPPASDGPDFENTAKGRFKAWLKQAEVWEEREFRSDTLPPAPPSMVIIGLGEAGRHVLTYLDDYVTATWGQASPSQLRLALIDLSPTDDSTASTPSTLSAQVKTVSLHPRSIISGAPNLKWFPGDLRHPGTLRGRGRLALYTDLIGGKSDSQVWSLLENLLKGMSGTSVYLVADAFSSAGSSLIIDVAHLLKTIAPNSISSMRLFLAMPHAAWPDQLDKLTDITRNQRAFATLRELQRFQSQTSARFSYAPQLNQPELNAVCGGRLFDELVLFDGLGGEEKGHHPVDLSKEPVETGLASVLAGCLITLLNPEVSNQMAQMWANQTRRLGDNNSLQNYFVGAMGSYALYLPVYEMRRVLEARLTHQVLFDQETGWLGQAVLTDDGESRFTPGPIPVCGPAEVEAFFRRRGLPSAAAAQLNRGDFLRHVLDDLEVQLNQGPGPRLRWALGFVEALGKAVSGQQNILAEVTAALHRWTDPAVASTTDAAGSGNDPLNRLLGRKSSPVTAVSPTSANIPPLYRAWQDGWQRRRIALDRLQGVFAQRLIRGLDAEHTLYQKYLVPTQASTRMRERLWWWWSRTEGQAELKLIILPNRLDEPDPNLSHLTRRELFARNPETYALRADQIDRLLPGLLTLAAPLSRVLANIRIETYLTNTPDMANELAGKSTPLAREENHFRPVEAPTFRYLAAPNHLNFTDLENKTRAKFKTGDFRRLTTSDAVACRLLQVSHMLYLPNLTTYTAARQKYQPRADLHLFEPEQAAARWEEQARRKLPPQADPFFFSPEFVTLCVPDRQEALRLYGLALLYRLIKISPNTLEIESVDSSLNELLPDLTDWIGGSAHSAALWLVELLQLPSELTAFRDCIIASRPADFNERMNVLDAATSQFIRPWSITTTLTKPDQTQSRAEKPGWSFTDTPAKHDLALLLAGLLAEEEQE